MTEVTFVPLKQADQERMSRLRLHPQLPAIQPKEDVCGKEEAPVFTGASLVNLLSSS
jgi:hypothetical protein